MPAPPYLPWKVSEGSSSTATNRPFMLRKHKGRGQQECLVMFTTVSRSTVIPSSATVADVLAAASDMGLYVRARPYRVKNRTAQTTVKRVKPVAAVSPFDTSDSERWDFEYSKAPEPDLSTPEKMEAYGREYAESEAASSLSEAACVSIYA